MKFRYIILIIAFWGIFSTPILGYEDSSADFDTSLVAGLDYQYQEQSKILFTQVEGNYDTLNLSTKEYLDTIYYYSITKLKLGNIPFHFAVDENGQIFKTQSYEVLKLTEERYIVIAYLSNNPELTNKAKSSMLEIATDLSYKYGIQAYDVFSYAIEESDTTLSKLSLVDSNTTFSSSIESSLTDWKPSGRENLSYVTEVESVEHSDTVEIGNQLEVKVSLKNLNDFVWTSDRDPIYLSIKDSKESVYAVNREWDSFSKVTHIPSDSYVLPGDSVELTFHLDPKVLPGENSEVFNILKFTDEPFADSEFEVKFTVERGDKKLVKMVSPEYGFVNIRECRWFSCEKIEVADEGEVYIVVKEEEGWYMILFGQSKEGWVYSKYAQEI